jgi:hypothetical protein
MAEENKDCLQPLIEGKETVLEAFARIRETQKKIALATCDELIATAPKYCLQICTYMHERLPRELRDMVYEYTMDTVALDQEDRTVFVQTLEDFEDAPDPEALISKHEKDGMVMTYAHGPSYGAQQHIWDESFVGSEVRQEVVQEWFRKSTFDFGPNIDLIDRFLSSDMFGAGCEAVRITRNIEVAIGDSPLDGTRSLEALRSLSKIPKAARLRIDLSHCEKLFKKSEAQDRVDFQHVLQTLWKYISGLEKWTIEFVIPSSIGAEQGYDRQNRELTLPGYDVDMMVPGIPGIPGKELTVVQWLAKYDEVSKRLSSDELIHRLTILRSAYKLSSTTMKM